MLGRADVITAAVVRELVNAGLADDALIAALERIEATGVQQATARQARNQRYYQARRLKTSEKRLNSDDEPSVLKASESVLKRLNSDASRVAARVRDNPSLQGISGQEKKEIRANGSQSEFAEFWAQWPEKRDKGHARRAFETARKKANQADILAGIAYVTATPAWQDGKHVLAATWLNGERWLDEPEGGTGPPKLVYDADFNARALAKFRKNRGLDDESPGYSSAESA